MLSIRILSPTSSLVRLAAKSAVTSCRMLSTKFEPMFDRVLVKKIEPETSTKGGIMLPENQSKVNSGEIIAVGGGARNRQGDFYKPLLKVGDKVMLPEYGGTKVDINGETHWVYREGDIVGRWS